MNGTGLLWAVLFGSVGAGYAVYGWRQRAALPCLCGVALMALPYLAPSPWVGVPAGLALAALPLWLRR